MCVCVCVYVCVCILLYTWSQLLFSGGEKKEPPTFHPSLSFLNIISVVDRDEYYDIYKLFIR